MASQGQQNTQGKQGQQGQRGQQAKQGQQAGKKNQQGGASGAGKGASRSALPIGIVCGLGNPGSEYVHTRHNAGFLVVDELASQLGARYWKTVPGALVAEVTLGSGPRMGQKLVLVKPQSFMNVSGGPLKKLAEQYHVQPGGILVVHDELEIDAGTVRVRMGGGHAGHNGLRSICEKLGTHDFPRVRVGIGRPPGRMAPADFVLKELRARDLEEFQVTVADAASAALRAVNDGLDAALARFGGK